MDDRIRFEIVTRLLVLLSWVLSGPIRPASAGDWPQILGPNRNGLALDEVPPDSLPSPPNERWTYSLGQGYAGPAVVADQVFVFHRVEGTERLEALDRISGRPKWQANFPANYTSGIDPDSGPRCVPVAVPDANLVLAFGAGGNLHAVKMSDGREVWTRELFSELGAPEGYFGAGSSPIVVGNQVLVNVGGRNEAGIVALDLKTGRDIWKHTDEDASYSSPILLDSTREPRVFFVTRYHALIIDPQHGNVLARRPFGQRGPTVNAASPILCDGDVFVTASYGVGSALLRTDDDKLTPRWSNDSSLSSQYNTPIYFERYLYGIHGREDVGRAELRCIEAQTGRVMWTVPDFGVAHIIAAGGRLLVLNTVGELRLVRATPERYRELSHVTLTKAKTRALPALSNGHLYLRENDGTGGRLMCIGL